MSKQRVAIVVFCDVDGDETDPDNGATFAIRQALTGSPIGDLPLKLPVVEMRRGPLGKVTVVGLRDVTTAALNGYLKVTATNRSIL